MNNGDYLKKSDFWKLAFSALFILIMTVSSMLVYMESRISVQLDALRSIADSNSRALIQLSTELKAKELINK